MTEKDLKKLSRLELLEILLEESRENERLRDEITMLKEKNSVQNSESNLIELSRQMQFSLTNANKLVSELQKITKDVTAVKQVEVKNELQIQTDKQANPTEPKKGTPIDENTKKVIISDWNLYRRIMQHYLRNEASLTILPPDIQKDIKNRLRGISNAGK